MADILKMLVGTPTNRKPSATTNVAIYTVPAGKAAMLSRVLVANSNAATTTFRIALVESGGTLAAHHYLAFDVPINGNDTINFGIGAGLAVGDAIYIYSANGNLVFTPVGIEVS